MKLSIENLPMNSSPNTQSWWKTFLDFLWDGGYRSTIVFTVTLGAIGITVYSDKLCRPMPTSVQPEPIAAPVKSEPIAATGKPPAATPGVPQLQQTVVAAQPNPICGKYFELAFMVVGGYLGLSTPKSTRTPPQGTNPQEENESVDPNNLLPSDNQNQGEGAEVTPHVPSLTTPQAPSPEQPVSSSPAPGSVQTVRSPAEAVSDGGEGRLQSDNPDNQQPEPQQINQQLPGFSRSGGEA